MNTEIKIIQTENGSFIYTELLRENRCAIHRVVGTSMKLVFSGTTEQMPDAELFLNEKRD